MIFSHPQHYPQHHPLHKLELHLVQADSILYLYFINLDGFNQQVLHNTTHMAALMLLHKISNKCPFALETGKKQSLEATKAESLFPLRLFSMGAGKIP